MSKKPSDELQKDENGNIVLNPVTGWIIGPVMEIAVLLAIQYQANPQKPDQEAGQI